MPDFADNPADLARYLIIDEPETEVTREYWNKLRERFNERLSQEAAPIHEKFAEIVKNAGYESWGYIGYLGNSSPTGEMVDRPDMPLSRLERLTAIINERQARYGDRPDFPDRTQQILLSAQSQEIERRENKND